MSDLYDKDVYTWALTQAEALRRRSANEIDWDNVAEEIESLGKGQSSELRSRYVTLLMHLLKWMFQHDLRSRSWEATIMRERGEIDRHLTENPGLKSKRDELFKTAYRTARLDAVIETGLQKEAFPETNPFTLEQAMDDDFWPEPPPAAK